MSDTYGPTSALPLMRYDLASSSWRTSEATSLWDLEMSSPTFPEWGMTRDGELSALPTPALPTVEPVSSSLPTPTARDYKDTQIRREPHRPDDTDTLSRALTYLLPTPTVIDMGARYTPEEWEAWKAAKKAIHGNGNGHGASLTQEAVAVSSGASTDPPFTDGSESSADAHPSQQRLGPTDDPDSLLNLLSG